MKRHIIVLCSILFVSAGLSGQSLQFMSINPDTRTLSMGNASVANDADAFSFYNNPASPLLSDKKGAVAVSYTMWQPDMSDNNYIGASGFAKIGNKFSLSAGMKYFNYSSVSIIDGNGNPNGTYSPKEYALGIGLGYLIAPDFSAAINLHYISSDMSDNASGSAFAGDIALMYKIKKIKIGLAASNIGSKVDYGYSKYSLPSNIKLGAGIENTFAEKHGLSASLETGYMLEASSFFAGIGAEYNFNKIVFARAGVYYGDKKKSTPAFGSFGLGINIKGVSLNGAYLLGGSDSPLKNTLSISLGYEF